MTTPIPSWEANTKKLAMNIVNQLFDLLNVDPMVRQSKNDITDAFVENIIKAAQKEAFENGYFMAENLSNEVQIVGAIAEERERIMQLMQDRHDELEKYAEWLDQRLMVGDWPEKCEVEGFKNEEEIRMRIGKNLCQAEQIEELLKQITSRNQE